MKETPHILLVNPWIHDFAAFDFWAKPLGLLTLAALLRLHGYRISYLDCLDRFHPKAPRTDPHWRHGRGPYLKQPIAKPQGLADVSRNYSRYGIRPEWFRQDLLNIDRPDLVMVTSMMTYWYPGLQESVRAIRGVFDQVPVWVGGIYATLCSDHCRAHSGADAVITGAGEDQILDRIDQLSGYGVTPRFDPQDLDTFPYPAFDLQSRINYIPLQTSRGCPFACDYCASKKINPIRMTRDPSRVVEEIRYWNAARGVEDFVFYDDALLMDAESHALPIFEGVIESGLRIRFHTPNALHIRWIDPKTADLMKRAGFATVRLGLETVGFDASRNLDSKVTAAEFRRAVKCLKAAGFDRKQVGAYLLAGLPNQSPTSLDASIRTVKEAGITPIPAYYSPIPNTRLWPEAVAASRYDLEADPVFTNNAVLPCRREPFSWSYLAHLKKRIQDGA
jgi:radical SAM superfamily enzyme YgiQ (UPF0313 family)